MNVIELPERWLRELRDAPETGMGYQIVSVTLHDGRRYDHVIVDSGHITRIRHTAGIPFALSDIAAIVVTHAKWDFNAERRNK